MTDQLTRWYVAQTRVNCEAQAVRNLSRQGYAVYCPRYRRSRRHARKVEAVIKPLFPRYLFVAIDLTTQRWRSIYSTLGVSHLITCDERPLALPEGVIEDIRKREDGDGFVRLQNRISFSPGEKVRVIGRAFADTLALFEGQGDRERVSILMDLLGRQVRVVLPVDMIARAD